MPFRFELLSYLVFVGVALLVYLLLGHRIGPWAW